VVTIWSRVRAKLNLGLLATVQPPKQVTVRCCAHTTERSEKGLAADHPVLIFVGFQLPGTDQRKEKTENCLLFNREIKITPVGLAMKYFRSHIKGLEIISPLLEH
jgi:hypothetical protein